MLTNLLIDGKKANAILETLGVRLGEDLAVGFAFAIENDVGADDTLGCEVEVADSTADLSRELLVLESLWWTNDDDLTSLELALGNRNLLIG